MKASRSIAIRRVFRLLMLLIWALVVLRASSPPLAASAPQYQLLGNPGLEAYDAPYARFQGVDCQVASHWQRFWYDGPEPFWMDTRVFASSPLGGGWVERIEGGTSQMVLSTKPYTAGLWQRVGGLTPGVGYGFHAAMLTIFQSSAQPSKDGTMIKQVGIDPSGGIDPRAPTVVWSEPNGSDKAGWDVRRQVAAFAQSDTVTVFIRVMSPYEAGPWPFMNLSFFDSAILAQTGAVAANSPEISTDPTFTVRWDNAVPSPGGEIRGYDVQWMDEAEGIWHDWFTEIDKDQVQATFSGERGHTYRFRVRVWQRYPNDAHLTSPYRSQGDTQTYVKGPEVVGRVLSPEGHAVGGATVALAGTSYAAVTGAGGGYSLRFPPTSAPQTVVVSHPYWLAPAPVYGLTIGDTETVELTWTLRPAGDVVINGGFEAGLTGWLPSVGGGIEAVLAPVHTGSGALALEAESPLISTTSVTQTAALVRAWEPALSFWYRADGADPGDRFRVSVAMEPATRAAGAASPPALASTLALSSTHVLTPALDVSGWQHLPLQLLPEAYFTGTVTIRFRVWNDGDGAETMVYLDEVSLGATPGGPYRQYLPLIVQGF